jgi:hypothetical protein
MRAAPLLATFALFDLVLVAVGGLTRPDGPDFDALRIPLGGILAVTAVGMVALALLSFAARALERLTEETLRILGGLLVGAAYAATIIGSLAWAALWLSPDFAPVALAGLASAGLLVWQLWAEEEWEKGRGR